MRGRPPDGGVPEASGRGVPTMADRKGYSTVYWGKMPVNFRPQDFPKHEVEAAVGYAERSFRDVADLVPDFSVLTLGAGPGGDIEAALVLGDEREAQVL